MCAGHGVLCSTYVVFSKVSFLGSGHAQVVHQRLTFKACGKYLEQSYCLKKIKKEYEHLEDRGGSGS